MGQSTVGILEVPRRARKGTEPRVECKQELLVRQLRHPSADANALAPKLLGPKMLAR